MTTRPLSAAVEQLRRTALREGGAGPSDGELLTGFVRRRDPAAFEALLRRHGPMVLGVCRRVLGNHADADDAFQANFLVLVRKAASVRPPGAVGGWLYGVAHNTARKARAVANKQRCKEREAAARPKGEAASASHEGLLAALDRELNALPGHYRAALVLCELEGRSIKEAALLTGCPAATLGTRLARGRRLLARRLARHGLMASGGAAAAALAQAVASAGVPPVLLSSTVKAALLAAGGAAAAGLVSAKAAALAEGVVKSMLLAKLKVVTAVLLAAAVVVPGACLLMGGATAARPAGPASVVKGSAAGPPAVSKGEKLKALMEKVRKAHGTSKQLAKHKTLRLKVEGKRLDIGEGDAFTRKETWRLPDQYRFEADAGHVDGVKSTLLGVVSKGKGWVRLTTGGVVTQEEELDKEDVASLGWGGAYTRALGVAPFLGDKGYALTYLGESKVNGKKAVGVLVKSKGLPDLKLYFDKASGLLLGAAHSVKAPGKEERWQLVFFSEYREKDGYKYPRRIVVHDLDGEELISEKVTAVEFPGELEDKVFAKP